MRKKDILTPIITLICLVVVVVLAFMMTYKSAERINVSDVKVWLAYDNSIESIVCNIDLITESEDRVYWAYLKDFDIEDDTYEEVLSLVTDDVRECYMEFTLSKEEYANGNPILKYREFDSISKRELEELRKDFKASTCMDRFDKYNDMEISEDEDTKVRFMKRIEILQEIYINEMYIKDSPSFDDLLIRKVLEVSEIEGLSAWLRGEYYRLK